MTQVPAGWYPDPNAPQSDGYGRVRYWDGVAWTEHVQMPTPAYAGPPAYQPPAYAYPASANPVPSTPDGVPLAGWWWRVLAQVIDGILLAPVVLLALAPAVASQWDELQRWFDQVSAAAENGTATPAPPSLFDPTDGAGLILLLLPVLVSLAYNIVFLHWKQATPGKLVLGMRVRLREHPGPLPWSAILARVGFTATLGLLAAVPYIGFAFSIAQLLNYLWPLWDPKKQALHDKVAGTNVVKVG
ncbi:RDD family protein [Marmoricola sp. RAF53]|uniref:RDD family protein n=1 Tax=Marmoricola sp. RAF53 TaxID=3233059 RepID=UPI003F9BFAC0